MSNPITSSGPQPDEVIPLSRAQQRQMHKLANKIGRTEIEADALRMPEGRQ